MSAPPGNEERRPGSAARDAADNSTAHLSVSVSDPAEVWAELAQCPPESQRWAGLAYYAGRVDEHIRIVEDFKQAGSAGAAMAKTSVWPLARMVDIKAARAADIHLCGSPKCTPIPRCSACVHAMSVLKRGGDYLGSMAVHSAATR